MESKHTILIVDDTPENLRLLGDMLEQEGYEVMVATNGPDALENARGTPAPDLILLDIMMPDMDGYQVCRRLKSDPDLKGIPVIFISALGLAEQKLQGFREGAVDYVTKPFQAEEVVARVRSHVRLHDLAERLEQKVRERTEKLTEVNLMLQQEIDERKRAEKELQESEEKYRTLVDNALVGIFQSTLSGDFLHVNQALLSMLGYETGEEFSRIKAWDIYRHKEDRENFIRILQEKGKVADLEVEFKTRSGTSLWVLINATLKDEILSGMFSNITELKLAERALAESERKLYEAQKMESLGILAGGVAHDFNNILAAIVGYTELAIMKLPPGSPAIDYLQKIDQSAARATNLAKQMLAYSGKGHFLLESIDINRLLNEMVNLLEVPISDKAKIHLNLTSPLPTVYADAIQIRQVIINLVINASEAIGDADGLITISTGSMMCDHDFLKDIYPDEKNAGGEYVCLEVADTGCGMDKETMAKIFDPFFSTKFTGRGLGMAALHGIVRGHKGAITVQSELNKGTVIKVLLPASKVPET